MLDVVAAIVARHPVMRLTLGEGRRFPDTLYASVEPDAPVRALQDELAAAFPTLPLYGGAFEFVPHVSIVEGRRPPTRTRSTTRRGRRCPSSSSWTRWTSSPAATGRWATRRRFPLGTAG